MAYRRIDDNDTVEIRRAQGGNKPETRTVAELNEYFSKEENTEINALEAQIGDYDPGATESTITDDLEELQTQVQTTTTGLLDRATALEAIVQTAVDGAPVTPVAATAKLAIGTGVSLDFTAKTAGVVGNAIEVELLDPGVDGDLSVSVVGNLISVTLGYASEAINSSLADIKAKIEDTPAANALVTVAVTGSDATLAIAVAKTALDNGRDGTPGAKGALRFGATALYVSTDASTTAVSNWETISFD